MLRLTLKKRFLIYLGDIILSATTLIQIFFALFQILLIDSGMMTEEKAGSLRVLGSVAFVFMSIFWILKRKFLLTLGVYLFTIILFFISGVLNSENVEFIMSEGFKFTLCICLPIFLCFVSIQNMRIFFRVAFCLSALTAFIGLIYVTMFLTGNLPMKETVYDMGLGYALLFPALYFFWHKGTVSTFVAVALTIIILLLGSRGPLVPIALFLIFQRFMLGSASEKWVLVLAILVIIASFGVIVNLMQDMGIESRTLYLLAEGAADSDSGRGDIYDIVSLKISESPIWGYGVFADRVFVNGIYCHNLFLELFIDFGCFVPLIIMFLIAVYVIKLLKFLSSDELLFLGLLFLASIIPLLVSGSYLTDFRLPFFFGYIYKLSHKYLPVKWRKQYNPSSKNVLNTDPAENYRNI